MRILTFRGQATAMWKWANLIAERVPAGKKLVWLNFDETPLQFQSAPGAGLVAAAAAGVRGTARPPRSHVSHRDLRASATLMAVTSNAAEIQDALPQVVLMNSKTLTLAQLRAVAAEVRGSQVEIWRGHTAWANAETVARWVAALGRALRPFRTTHFFALASDASPTHVHEAALRAMHRWNFAPCLIPALLTGVLQPLDVHVFASLKREGRGAMDRARLVAPEGRVSQQDAVSAWLRVIAVRMQRAEPVAFASVGLAEGQTMLGRRCERALQLPASWTPPAADLPSLEEMRLLTGSRKHLHLAYFFNVIARDPAPAPPAAPAAPCAPGRLPRGTLLFPAPTPRRPPAPSALAGWTRPVTRSRSTLGEAA